ncbi:GNAT family N-acetyltransferase [Cryobacterium arcticum]|uniref:GNAT family N-acetyltransferase n=1 Tax=Cryobacterium arcticum TaxID=670052 RepID=UPI0015E86DE2|nr:GNAT family N-acetyltransferase [Cryobacterium arcticum]
MTVATTTEQVEALRPLWQSMSVSNLDADIDYFLAVVAHLPGVIAPHVLSVERPGRPAMIIVARLERHVFPVTVGYTELLRPHLKTVVVSFDGILGAQSEDDLAAAVLALRSTLRSGRADAVILQKVGLQSALHRAAVAGSARVTRIGGIAATRRWLVTLPDTLDLLLEGRSVKARKKAHYESRRLRRTYDSVEVIRLDRVELERVLGEIEAVARTTYQRALGVGASESALGRALTTLSFERGWLRVWMLHIDGSPAAFWWGNQHGDTFSVDTPGFDPRYTKDGVGTFVLHAMLDELCQDPTVAVVDFGHGYAEYKERYASQSVEQRDVIVLAARVRPLLTGQFVALLATVNRMAYRLLRNRSFATRLRRTWRARLTERRGAD